MSISVCRATIKKVLKGNYPAYTGKEKGFKKLQRIKLKFVVNAEENYL